MQRDLTIEPGEPVWELAHLYPYQGGWSVADYLALDTTRLIEYDEGYLEVLPMPTREHQRIVALLYRLLFAYVEQRGLTGEVLFAPLRVRIGDRQFQEPDVSYSTTPRGTPETSPYPEATEIGLAMEVVSGSPAERDRDLVRKRRDYAAAGIPEYWIVDPQDEVVTVLRLDGNAYVEHGRFHAGDETTSATLPGFGVPVADVWAAAQH